MARSQALSRVLADRAAGAPPLPPRVRRWGATRMDGSASRKRGRASGPSRGAEPRRDRDLRQSGRRGSSPRPARSWTSPSGSRTSASIPSGLAEIMQAANARDGSALLRKSAGADAGRPELAEDPWTGTGEREKTPWPNLSARPGGVGSGSRHPRRNQERPRLRARGVGSERLWGRQCRQTGHARQQSNTDQQISFRNR